MASKMKARFAPPDPKYDIQMLKKDFVDRFLSCDDFDLDDDELAIRRDAMFAKLAELADVIKEVKEESKKRKRG